MALRPSLPVQPHLYIADASGRPLDYGKVYFGQVNKDPEIYPINVYSDSLLTIHATQPIRTKLGFLNINGDMAEIYAVESSYSVKVLDSNGVTVFYKPDMIRNSAEVPVGSKFPLIAPLNSQLLSEIDNRFYIKREGGWLSVDNALEEKLDDHAASQEAHGLRANNITLGRESLAAGSYAVAVGHMVNSSSGYSLGREVSNTSTMTSAIGYKVTVEGGTRNSVLGSYITSSNSSYSVSIGDGVNNLNSEGSVALGRTTSVGTSVDGVVIGRTSSLSTSYRSIAIGYIATGTYAPNSISIGSNAKCTGLVDAHITTPISIGFGAATTATEAIAIGTRSKSNHEGSVAIGKEATTSAVNQIQLGTAVNTVNVLGNFDVAGTKNFKIPHPVPSKNKTHSLYHASYEGDIEGGTIYRRHLTAIDSKAVLELPEWFEYLNKDVDIVVSPKGHFGSGYANIEGNTLTLTTNADGDYLVIIFGTRNDTAVQNWRGVEVLNDK